MFKHPTKLNVALTRPVKPGVQNLLRQAVVFDELVAVVYNSHGLVADTGNSNARTISPQTATPDFHTSHCPLSLGLYGKSHV